MRVTADTNVVLRILVRDDLQQAELVAQLLRDASLIAIGLVTLCEVAWLLRGTYKVPPERIAAFFRQLLSVYKIELNRSAVEAGLALLDAGGDFSDGVIEYEGSWLGGETFLSFDKTAVKLLSSRGHSAKLLR